MPYKYILDFTQISKEDIPQAGGKGANLGEMTHAGFPVPPGFVATSQAYKLFLQENKLEKIIRDILHSHNLSQSKKASNNPTLYQKASEEIEKAMLKGTMPKLIKEEILNSYKKIGSFFNQPLVAVRSSATAEDLPDASFAGQQSTFLNVKGKQELLKAVQDCWASLFTPRAIFYREEKKFNHFKVGIAVVIQKMIQPEVSGIAFTTNPITQDKHKMVIEAVWGLGEFAVQGTVTPDKYEIERHSLQILNIERNSQKTMLIKKGNKNKEEKVPRKKQEKQKLAEGKIKELARILREIHTHYFFPQDVEWAYTKGKFYIIQARPITTLTQNETSAIPTEKTSEAKPGEVLLQGQGASPGLVTGVVKIVHNQKELSKVKKGDILVAKMTSPDYVPAMKQAAAIVTDEGGITSHAAIVSRELGVPCVVGTKMATQKLKDGLVITVNGKIGVVYKGKPSTTKEAKEKQKQEESTPPSKDIKTATKIYVNLAEPERVEEIAKFPVSGVGLLRAEFMIAQIGTHPKHLIAERKQHVFVDKLTEGLQTFCKAFNPRPVVYRTTDFKTNEYRNLKGGKSYEPEEPNPMMGYRGAFRYIADPDVFELELASIKKVRETYKNLWVMIPFVRNPAELKNVKQIMASAGLIRSPTFKLWLMVELPANVILIEDFIKVGIDGVSIGSNDLTMLTLGTDRDNQDVATAYSETNPAVLKLLEKTIKACRKHGVTSSICGQAPSTYDELVEFLVRTGITSMSINPDSIGRVQRVIHDAERKMIIGR